MTDLKLDYTVQLINLIKTADGVGDARVGEKISQATTFPYIFVRQSGQAGLDQLDCSGPDSTFFDCEVISDDIVWVRNVTAAIKQLIWDLANWPESFEGRVQYIDVDDHDDEYISRAAQYSEDDVEVGALQLTLHH